MFQYILFLLLRGACYFHPTYVWLVFFGKCPFSFRDHCAHCRGVCVGYFAWFGDYGWKKIITYICLVEQKDCNCLSEKLIFSDKSCIIEKIVKDSFQVVWLGKSCKTVDELNYGPAK